MNNQIKSIYHFYYHNQDKKIKTEKKIQSKKGKSNKSMKGKDAVL